MPVPKPSTRPSLKFSLPRDELKAMFQAGLAIAEAQRQAREAAHRQEALHGTDSKAPGYPAPCAIFRREPRART